MGEAAESLLDGTMCEGCGVYLDGESPGYPRYCSKTCAEYRGIEFFEDNHPALQEVNKIKEALKEYKILVWKMKCKCLEGKHHPTCKVGKHRKLQKEAWESYKEYVEY